MYIIRTLTLLENHPLDENFEAQIGCDLSDSVQVGGII